LSPSRPIPTATDATINAEEVLLLQYAFSRTDQSLISMFFKQMAIVYGTAIDCQSLRYAILANAASLLPSTQFQNPFYHYTAQACRALRSKLNPLSCFDEGDLFAVFVLLFTTNDYEEAFMHANGCIRMLQALSEHARTKAVSDVFRVFVPCVRSYLATYFYAIEGRNWRPEMETTFKERLRYWVELYRAANIALRDAEQTRYLVLTRTLRDLARVALVGLYCMLRDEESQQFQKRQMLECMRQVLGDPDLQQTWKHLQSSGERESWPTAFIDMATLELAEAIFLMPDILLGLSSPRIADLARNQILGIREKTQKEPAEYRPNFVKILQYEPHRVGLGAVALPLADIPNCECLDFPQANF
jgi:hypothetical protein